MPPRVPLLPGKARARSQRLAVSNGARSRGTRTKGGVVSGVRSAQGGASRCRFKPYSAYKGSGVEWLGEIPAHWAAVPFRRLVRRIEQGWSPVATIAWRLRKSGP